MKKLFKAKFAQYTTSLLHAGIKKMKMVSVCRLSNSNGEVSKEFSKYLEAYVWLKGEPKFGT